MILPDRALKLNVEGAGNYRVAYDDVLSIPKLTFPGGASWAAPPVS